MATGVDDTGEAANFPYMIDQIEMLPNLSGLDKVRFLCILFISQRGVLDEEMETRVFEAANLSPFDMSIFKKLEYSLEMIKMMVKKIVDLILVRYSEVREQK